MKIKYKKTLILLSTLILFFLSLFLTGFVSPRLNIINQYSNPILGGIWEVKFEEDGFGIGGEDLRIKTDENTKMPEEIEYVGLFCGDKEFVPEEKSTTVITFKNWKCESTASLRFRVNNEGSHKVTLLYGKSKEVAHNFACSSGDLSTTCTVSSSQAMSSDETISGTGNLTIASGGNLTTTSAQTFTINLTGESSTVTIQSGGAITGNVTINAVTIDVQSGGSINADSKGYAAPTTARTNGNGTGGGGGGVVNATTTDGGGGGYGGNGGSGRDNPGVGGTAYDSITSPTSLGSSGGSGQSTTYIPGAGGGLVVINASGTLTIAGTVSVNGGSVASSAYGASGGGSGGAVNITAGTVTGAGSITSNGGAGGFWTSTSTYQGGGGGGGRIAIKYTTKTSYTVTSTAYGGVGYEYGGAGTIYDAQSGTNGTLIINNNSNSGVATKQVTNDYTFDNVTIDDGGYFLVDTGRIFMSSASFGESSSSSTFQIKGTFVGPSSLTIPSNLNFTVTSGCTVSGVSSMTVNSGGTFVFDSFTSGGSAFDDIGTITINGNMTHTANSTSETHIINLSASTFTLGGTINLDSRGYLGPTTARTNGNGTGGGGGGLVSATATDGGGGGHGGSGGAGKDNGGAGGITYGLLTSPVLLGSSGGTGQSTASIAGAGGGAMIMNISGTLSVGGTISANGGSVALTTAYGASGGGSGGAVNITAGTISGSGNITANGGAGGVYSSTPNGGGGGGGRILIRGGAYSYAGTPTATGGTGSVNGSAGTIELAPKSSDTLNSDNTSAQAGSTNPTGLTDTTPAFSAICRDPDSSADTMNKAQIQVSTDSTFATITHWDSDATNAGDTISDCTSGSRSADIVYGSFGDAPAQSLATNDGAITYYWRIRFWDDDGAYGAWSTETATFTMQDAGGLSIDIVNASDEPVSDTVSMSSITYSNTSSQTSTGTMPSGTNKLKIINSGGGQTWDVTMGPTSGSGATWNNAGNTHHIDFNDTGGAGQLTVNADNGTLTGVDGTSTTGVTKNGSTAFTGASVTILSAGDTAPATGTWTLTGVSLSQTIPAKTSATTYTIELTITIS